MIKLMEILRNPSILVEQMSFKQLLSRTDGGRRDRGSRMRVRSLAGTANENEEQFNFSYKSSPDHITTMGPHEGRISFEKDAYVKYKNKRSMDDVMCKVDCSCPDYKYRWAYANAAQDAGEMGTDTLNQCNGSVPRQTNPRLKPSLCKHLVALKDYLRTKLQENDGGLDERLSKIIKENPTFVVEYKENDN
jgi:hypothetical protein